MGPKRFLDPSPIYLSTDQKTRTTLFFGIWDPGSQLYQPIYQGFDRYPKKDSWIPVLSTYLPTKKHALPFILGSGIRDPSSINLSTKDLTDTQKIPGFQSYLIIYRPKKHALPFFWDLESGIP